MIATQATSHSRPPALANPPSTSLLHIAVVSGERERGIQVCNNWKGEWALDRATLKLARQGGCGRVGSPTAADGQTNNGQQEHRPSRLRTRFHRHVLCSGIASG